MSITSLFISSISSEPSFTELEWSFSSSGFTFKIGILRVFVTGRWIEPRCSVDTLIWLFFHLLYRCFSVSGNSRWWLAPSWNRCYSLSQPCSNISVAIHLCRPSYLEDRNTLTVLITKFFFLVRIIKVKIYKDNYFKIDFKVEKHRYSKWKKSSSK